MSKGCARNSKRGCGGRAAGRAVRIDEYSVTAQARERPSENVFSEDHVNGPESHGLCTSGDRVSSRLGGLLGERVSGKNGVPVTKVAVGKDDVAGEAYFSETQNDDAVQVNLVLEQSVESRTRIAMMIVVVAIAKS